MNNKSNMAIRQSQNAIAISGFLEFSKTQNCPNHIIHGQHWKQTYGVLMRKHLGIHPVPTCHSLLYLKLICSSLPTIHVLTSEKSGSTKSVYIIYFAISAL